VISRMLEFEKYFKKYDNRLKNLNLRLKDTLEDRKAHRIISKSRERRQTVPRTDYRSMGNSSVEVKETVVSPKMPKCRADSAYKSQTRTEGAKQKEFA
jgi:hypothetical protein